MLLNVQCPILTMLNHSAPSSSLLKMIPYARSRIQTRRSHSGKRQRLRMQIPIEPSFAAIGTKPCALSLQQTWTIRIEPCQILKEPIPDAPYSSETSNFPSACNQQLIKRSQTLRSRIQKANFQCVQSYEATWMRQREHNPTRIGRLPIASFHKPTQPIPHAGRPART
jgi:hypothetical protein